MNIGRILSVAVPLLFFATPAVSELTWSEIDAEAFMQGCVAGVVAPAKRAYFARAEEMGNDNPKPFPEDELVKSVEPMCSCVATKLEENGISPVAAAIPSQEAQEIIQQVISGGECKLGGRIGDAISEKIQDTEP